METSDAELGMRDLTSIKACEDPTHGHDPAMMCGIIVNLWDRVEALEAARLPPVTPIGRLAQLLETFGRDRHEIRGLHARVDDLVVTSLEMGALLDRLQETDF